MPGSNLDQGIFFSRPFFLLAFFLFSCFLNSFFSSLSPRPFSSLYSCLSSFFLALIPPLLAFFPFSCLPLFLFGFLPLSPFCLTSLFATVFFQRHSLSSFPTFSIWISALLLSQAERLNISPSPSSNRGWMVGIWGRHGERIGGIAI